MNQDPAILDASQDAAPVAEAVEPAARITVGETSIQLLVPGLYAWAVTIAPPAWASGASVWPKAFALLAVFSLLAAVVIAQKNVQIARNLSLWGFVVFGALTLLFAPSYGVQFDASRGIAGVFGWLLFAFAASAPSLLRRSVVRAERDPRLAPRSRSHREGWLLAVGMVIALGLQALGWDATPVERAVLLRLLALGAGLAMLALVTLFVEARADAYKAPRIRTAAWTIVAIGALGWAGLRSASTWQWGPADWRLFESQNDVAERAPAVQPVPSTPPAQTTEAPKKRRGTPRP